MEPRRQEFRSPLCLSGVAKRDHSACMQLMGLPPHLCSLEQATWFQNTHRETRQSILSILYLENNGRFAASQNQHDVTLLFSNIVSGSIRLETH